MRISTQSEYLIDLLNLCLQSSPSSRTPWDNSPRPPLTKATSALNLSFVCPADLRGVFHHRSFTTNHSHQVPKRILVFPGSSITRYLMRVKLPSDGRHYGVAMYIPFLRAIQGVSHEFSRMRVMQAEKLQDPSVCLDANHMAIEGSPSHTAAWKRATSLCTHLH
jgi:hypothetical protein